MSQAAAHVSPPRSLNADDIFIRDAINLIRSGAQVMLIPSKDEKSIQQLFIRIAEEINAEMQRNNRPKSSYTEVIIWDCVYGFMKAATAEVIDIPNGNNLRTALSTLVDHGGGKSSKFPTNALVLMFDPHNYLNGMMNSAERRILAMGARNNMFVRSSAPNPVPGAKSAVPASIKRPIFLIQPDNRTHADISDCVNLLKYDLPGTVELGEVLSNVCKGLPPEVIDLSEQDRYDLTHAMKGLTKSRAYDVLSLAVVKHRKMSAVVIPTIQTLKSDMISLSNRALEFIPYEQLSKSTDVIGYDDLLDYVDTRAQAYAIEAEAFNLDYPKGMVISGIPGTGKTQAARMVAKRLRLPLIRYNVGALYASAVGASEEMAREAHRIITRTDGCVVFIDEADKMFNSITDGKNDGGVGQRVFSEILTWMSEKNDRNMVIMALNRFDGIPDELFRKGRFDEMFYVDLPNDEQRQQILEVHMKAKGLDPAMYQSGMAELVDATNNFVGVELLQVIIDSKSHEFVRTDRKSATPSVDLMVQIARRIAPFCQFTAGGGKMTGFDLVKKKSRPVFSLERPFRVVKKVNA